jgi:hypothetical protein
LGTKTTGNASGPEQKQPEHNGNTEAAAGCRGGSEKVFWLFYLLCQVRAIDRGETGKIASKTRQIGLMLVLMIIFINLKFMVIS